MTVLMVACSNAPNQEGQVLFLLFPAQRRLEAARQVYRALKSAYPELRFDLP
jgi:hypothetical protein